MRRFLNILIVSLLLASCSSKPRELVILSVNDMHAHIEMMPRLAYIADSLRAIYPELMLVSAGDNRTGNAYNDKYPEHSNLPMITLMNEMGFEASALGNHEFDGNIEGIKYFIDNVKFPVICSNANFSAYPDIKIDPYTTIVKSIDGKKVKITLLGTIETENGGKPSAHPDNLKNMEFVEAGEIIDKYLYLRDDCDVFILLSHCGLSEELRFAEKYPQFDMIIGGHSHDLYTKEFDNGVLYTQSKYYLKRATVTKLTLVDGKVVNKETQVIDLEKVKKVDQKIQDMVDHYYANPEFKTVVGHADTPFSDKDALGAYMADAARYLTKADIAMQNPGGVRLDSLGSGDIILANIYNLDPFNNSLVVVKMTGKQVEEYLELASTNDKGCTHVSGITYTIDYVRSDDGQSGFIDAKAYLENGKRIDSEKIYTVALNSYIAKWAEGRSQSIEYQNLYANDAEIAYLKEHKNVAYQGVKRYKCKIVSE